MFQTCISMISTLMSSWARFRVFPGRFTCKRGASGRIWSALHCLYPASAKLSVGTGVPQCSQCQLSAGTGVPGAGQCQPAGWHSGAQCPASGAALQCLSPVPVALCASWREADASTRSPGPAACILARTARRAGLPRAPATHGAPHTFSRWPAPARRPLHAAAAAAAQRPLRLWRVPPRA